MKINIKRLFKLNLEYFHNLNYLIEIIIITLTLSSR